MFTNDLIGNMHNSNRALLKISVKIQLVYGV